MIRRVLLFLLLACGVAQANVPCSVPNTFVNNTIADANQVNANFMALISCLLNAAKAGDNSDITSLNGLTSPILPSQGGSSIFFGGASTGTPNAQVIAATIPSGFTLTAGYTVMFTAGFTNTLPPTPPPTVPAFQINVNSTGLTDVYKMTPTGPVPMIGGEIILGQIVTAVYDGTRFLMTSPGPQFGGFGGIIELASATSVELALATTHNASINGTTTITSFGENAQLAFPIYLVSFHGVMQLTSFTPDNSPACNPGSTGGCLFLPGSPANILTGDGDTALVEFLGKPAGGKANWAVTAYSRSVGASLRTGPSPCGFNHLTWTSVGSTTTVTASWGNAALLNPGQATIFSGQQLGLTLNTTTVGAGGMDLAAAAGNAFTYMYGISNGTAFNLLGTANPPPANPTLPSGYIYACYLGAVRTATSSSSLLPIMSAGNEAHYIGTTANPRPQIFNGTTTGACAGAPTAFTVRGTTGAVIFMPANAVAAQIYMSNVDNGAGTAGTVGLYTNADAVSEIAFFTPTAAGIGVPWMFFESNNIYGCGNGGGASFRAYGWRDAVNAN